MRLLSYIVSVIILCALLYTVVVTTIYLISFLADFSGKETGIKAVVLTLYFLTIQGLVFLYSKMPYKPQSSLFIWVEKINLFGTESNKENGDKVVHGEASKVGAVNLADNLSERVALKRKLYGALKKRDELEKKLLEAVERKKQNGEW